MFKIDSQLQMTNQRNEIDMVTRLVENIDRYHRHLCHFTLAVL